MWGLVWYEYLKIGKYKNMFHAIVPKSKALGIQMVHILNPSSLIKEEIQLCPNL